MVLVYYRLYITYTLTEFLFSLDQSNACRDVEKIEGLIKECTRIRTAKTVLRDQEVKNKGGRRLKSIL